MTSQRGLQLLELMLVVAILAVTALVAIPHFATTDASRLDLAAEEVADALRFAQAEALRTGQPHGVLIDHDNSNVTYKDYVVYRVNTGASPFGVAAVLYHPVDRQPYDRLLGAGMTGAASVFANTAAPFTFSGVVGEHQDVHFNGHGQPVQVRNGTSHRLLAGNIVLKQGNNQRAVSLQPATGRVTVQ